MYGKTKELAESMSNEKVTLDSKDIKTKRMNQTFMGGKKKVTSHEPLHH